MSYFSCRDSVLSWVVRIRKLPLNSFISTKLNKFVRFKFASLIGTKDKYFLICLSLYQSFKLHEV
jgi:hypothetical protein